MDHVYGESVILDYLASKRISTGAAWKCGTLWLTGQRRGAVSDACKRISTGAASGS